MQKLQNSQANTVTKSARPARSPEAMNQKDGARANTTKGVFDCRNRRTAGQMPAMRAKCATSLSPWMLVATSGPLQMKAAFNCHSHAHLTSRSTTGPDLGICRIVAFNLMAGEGSKAASLRERQCETLMDARVYGL